MAANMLRKTPLHQWHRDHGAKMVDFGGWDMPVQYQTGILQEHLSTRRYGGLFDVSHMGRFRILGDRRIPFLQHVLSNNAEALEPWQAQYTLVPDAGGGLVDDAYLYQFGEGDYLLVVNASNAEKDWQHFHQHAASFPGLVLENQTDNLAMIALQGPVAGRILEEVIEEGALPMPFRNSLSKVRILGAEILMGRTGYTGEPICFELFVPARRSVEVWELLIEKGRAAGVVPVGLGARDTLRLEAGLPLYGHEFGIDPSGKEIPAFAFPLTGIAVSFSSHKGDFIGRGALMRQFEEVKKLLEGTYRTSEVLPRRIRTVAIQDRGIARQGDQVFIGDRNVGVVTSGTMAPCWTFEGDGASMHITEQVERRALALALMDADLQFDQDVEVVVRKNRLKGKIVRWHGRSDAPPYFRPTPADWSKPEREPAAGEGLEKAKLVIRKALENHEWRQHRCINLIPSEMTPSPLLRMLQVTDPAGRYAEHRELPAFLDQDVFYYQGTDFIAWVEDRLCAEMAEFMGCPLVEARAISGQMANMTVFSAFVDYKNRVDRRREPERIRLAMNNHIGFGGHLSSQPMGALRDYIARDPVTEHFAVVNFPVCEDNRYRIDVPETAKMLERIGAKPVFDPGYEIGPLIIKYVLIEKCGQFPVLGIAAGRIRHLKHAQERGRGHLGGNQVDAAVLPPLVVLESLTNHQLGFLEAFSCSRLAFRLAPVGGSGPEIRGGIRPAVPAYDFTFQPVLTDHHIHILVELQIRVHQGQGKRASLDLFGDMHGCAVPLECPAGGHGSAGHHAHVPVADENLITLAGDTPVLNRHRADSAGQHLRGSVCALEKFFYFLKLSHQGAAPDEIPFMGRKAHGNARQRECERRNFFSGRIDAELMTIERQAGLQAKRIPCSEAHRYHTGGSAFFDEELPDFHGSPGGNKELKTDRLPCIAGTSHQDFRPQDSDLGKTVPERHRQCALLDHLLENPARHRPLQGDHGQVIRLVFQNQARERCGMLMKMLPVLLCIGGVYHQEIVPLTELVKVGIIHQASACVGHQGILRLPGLEGFRVVGKHVLQKRNPSVAQDAEPTHMAYVEQPAVSAGRQMLLQNSGLVLHRHVPPAEIDHLGSMVAMPLM